MNWKKQLRQLEELQEWDFAIDLMQKIIDENPAELDPYLSMNYLLMNLLVEEKHDETKHNYYEKLIQQYFNESHKKFSDNAEYLFYTGMTAVMSEWYFDETYDVSRTMLHKATLLEPNNMLYKWGYYGCFNRPTYTKERYLYAQEMLSDKTSIKELLLSKGAVGDFILMMMNSYLNNNPS